MSLSGISGSSSLGALANASSKSTFGAEVVSKTLDYMNSSNSGIGSMGQSYQFQKDVLNAYAGKGTAFDLRV